jgi:uncharacterized protein (TIGR02145 family)
MDCGVEAKHDNEKSEQVSVKKTALSFKNATATGNYNDDTSEKVWFEGILNFPDITVLDSVVIEIFSNATGVLVPIPDISIIIKDINTNGFTTELPFGNVAPFIIPATDMCNLWLVIRKTSIYNQYLCDSVAIHLPPPAYNLTPAVYSTCPNIELAVGDDAIPGYSYSWNPATNIVGSSTAMPVKINYLPSEAGDKILNVTITRSGGSGCPVGASAALTVKALPEISTDGVDAICLGKTIQLLPDNGGVWVSTDDAVATVTNDGVATSESEGMVRFIFTSDDTGCSDTTGVITVNALPVVSIAGAASICVNAITQLSPSTGGIWESTDDAVATVADDGIVTGVSEGTARFIFTSDDTGCSDTTGTVTVKPLPVALIAGDGDICIDGTIILSPIGTGTWTSTNTSVAEVNSLDATVTITGAGEVRFIFTSDATGCLDTTGTVTVNAKTKPIFIFAEAHTYCQGDDIPNLPTESLNDPPITGTWSPATVSTFLPGEQTYTFIPDAGQCAENNITVLVTVLERATPDYIIANDEEVCYGDPATFTASSTEGGTPTFSWYSSQTATTWLAMGESFNAGIFTSDTAFYVGIFDENHCENSSNNRKRVKLTVNNATITQPTPFGQTICPGEIHTFNLGTATGGTGAITYQWLQSSTNAAPWENAEGISNEQNYTTPALTANMYYKRVATGATCGTHTTFSALITMKIATAITTHPSAIPPMPVCEGDTVSFPKLSISKATGMGTLTYQWFRNTTGVPSSSDELLSTQVFGSTTPSYEVLHTPSYSGLPPGDYYYYVVVKGDCGTDTSNMSGVHTVNKTTITQPNPIWGTICSGTAHTFSLSAATGGTGAITYQWLQSSTNTGPWVDAAGTSDEQNYTTPALIANMYYKRVAAGDICGVDTTTAALVNITAAPAITVHPSTNIPTLVCYGISGSFPQLSVTATGTGLSYQWYRNTTPSNSGGALISGAVNATYTPLTGGLSADNYYYYVVVTNVCGTETSNVSGVHTIFFCDLLDCTAMPNRFVEEDGYKEGYTHSGTDWDAVVVFPGTLDSIRYIVNSVISTETTLNGVKFPAGASEIMVIAYYLHLSDTCEFTVYVERACPPNVFDDEDNEYKVTKLVGLCWTENLKATKYAINLDEGVISFAKPYTCTNCPLKLDTIFGLLYTWYSAVGVSEDSNVAVPQPVQGICPEGWRIPTQAEWALLESYDAGQLRSTEHWLNPPGPGTDDYGFDARPAGWYNGATNRFEELYGFAGWWASDVADPGSLSAHHATVTYYCNHTRNLVMRKHNGLSVRCVLEWGEE